MKHKIDYSISGELFPDELGNLLNAVFETIYTPRELSRIIVGSTAYVTARYSGVLVGFGRILSDGATIAYINYMAVNREYQRKGIGKKLLENCLERFKHVRSKILLTDDEEAQKYFYESLGFKNSKDLNKFRLNTYVMFDGLE